MNIDTGKYLIRLLDKNNNEELREVQRLRYKYLLQIYNPNLPDGGLDNDGYDEYSDTLLVIDKGSGEIAGGYRLSTKKSNYKKHFLTEEEYDIKELIDSNDDFVELSRAFVRKEYQNGVVIALLFLGIYHYTIENNCKYFIGLCSFHGTNPNLYQNAFSLLKSDYSFTDYEFKAIKNSFNLDYYKKEEIDYIKARKEIPGLLKMYLKFGCKVGYNGTIDYSFNCIDVLLCAKVCDLDERYINHLLRYEIN